MFVKLYKKGFYAADEIRQANENCSNRGKHNHTK